MIKRLVAATALIAGGSSLFAGCAKEKAVEARKSVNKWTEFVEAKGHANPIPKVWMATPEGKFAHDLKIPNPVPADAGYKEGMKPVEYYQLLCDKEAGEFTFKTVNGVDGLYFARPPVDPTDDDLKDRWKVEHPWLESKFQLVRTPAERAVSFVNPPFMKFKFYEEPNQNQDSNLRYMHMSGYQQDMRDEHDPGKLILKGTPMQEEQVGRLASRYGMTWRGVHRPHDRENGIAGGEAIIYDLQTNEVLYVFRNYAFSGRTKGTPDGIWWLNSGGCQRVFRKEDFPGLHSLASRAREILKIVE